MKEIYDQIMTGSLEFPHFMKDSSHFLMKHAKSLISQLLDKSNPNSRLGGSFSNLKSHPFFSGFDWVYLFIFRIHCWTELWLLPITFETTICWVKKRSKCFLLDPFWPIWKIGIVRCLKSKECLKIGMNSSHFEHFILPLSF